MVSDYRFPNLYLNLGIYSSLVIALNNRLQPMSIWIGNPIGGLTFSSAFGQLEEIHEWTVSSPSAHRAAIAQAYPSKLTTPNLQPQNFVTDSIFCFRACKPGPMAPVWCQHIYDTLGCFWNMPANYSAGVFEQCQGDSGEVRPPHLGYQSLSPH